MPEKKLTVGELITILQSLPKFLPVMYYNAQYMDYDPANEIVVKDVVQNQHCSGSYVNPLPGDEPLIKAVIIL